MAHPQADVVTRLRAAGCVFAEDEARLLAAAASTPDELAAMVGRRAAGLPLEQVLGWAEFCGLRIAVDPGVFVPRRRTEFLARQAAALIRATALAGPAVAPAGPARVPAGPARAAADRAGAAAGPAAASAGPAAAGKAPPRPRIVVVDLCCGSGAVGAALAAASGGIELHAVDLDPAAAACAGRNLAATGGLVYQGDLYEPLPAALRGRVNVLVANPPYVPSAAVGLLPAEARVHEPRAALDGGADGLDILRRVAAAAPDWLAPAGHLLVETGERQAPRAAEAVARCGLAARVARSAALGATVVIGSMRPAAHLTMRPASLDR